jgi:hypothetical protein
MRTRSTTICTLMLAVSALAACGDDGVSSTEAARRAYYGLDTMIGKAMDLGFAGFNAATSANIPTQTASGTVKGTLTVTGKVDQGSSKNKEMRLNTGLVDYQDDATNHVVYATSDTSLPALDLSLKSIPTGTLTGTLAGAFSMTGDLTGVVTLSLSMAGELQADPVDATKVLRKPGTTRVTGTAQSTYGVFAVDLTR